MDGSVDGWMDGSALKTSPSDLKHFPLVEKLDLTSTHNAALWRASQFPFQTPCDKKKSKHKIPSSIARAAAAAFLSTEKNHHMEPKR
jgi:hypothetical protein